MSSLRLERLILTVEMLRDLELLQSKALALLPIIYNARKERHISSLTYSHMLLKPVNNCHTTVVCGFRSFSDNSLLTAFEIMLMISLIQFFLT